MIMREQSASYGKGILYRTNKRGRLRYAYASGETRCPLAAAIVAWMVSQVLADR